jgi:predicted SnoaL-like aldol condensation-catalyzing enzyme
MTNKEIVQEFTKVVFNEKNLEVLDQYMKEDYIQHNPTVKQGREGFIDFAQNRFFKAFPNVQLVIKHIYEDGDTVVCHNLAICEPGENENIVFDVYRLEDGKLAEHWDCIQHLTKEQMETKDTLF